MALVIGTDPAGRGFRRASLAEQPAVPPNAASAVDFTTRKLEMVGAVFTIRATTPRHRAAPCSVARRDRPAERHRVWDDAPRVRFVQRPQPQPGPCVGSVRGRPARGLRGAAGGCAIVTAREDLGRVHRHRPRASSHPQGGQRLDRGRASARLAGGRAVPSPGGRGLPVAPPADQHRQRDGHRRAQSHPERRRRPSAHQQLLQHRRELLAAPLRLRPDAGVDPLGAGEPAIGGRGSHDDARHGDPQRPAVVLQRARNAPAARRRRRRPCARRASSSSRRRAATTSAWRRSSTSPPPR